MSAARVKDWVIGAVAMLLVLMVVFLVLLWWASSPAGEGADDGDHDTGTGTSTGADRAEQERTPPMNLGPGEVWLGDLRLDADQVLTPDSRLRDVHVVAEGVRTGPRGLVGAEVRVKATVPFEVLAAELGHGTTVRAAEGGQATVVRDVEALGRELHVVATSTVEVEDGRLVVEPRSIDLGTPDFVSDALGTVVRALVTIEHDVEGLPKGLTLRDVDVRDDGFRVQLRGQGVTLVP